MLPEGVTVGRGLAVHIIHPDHASAVSQSVHECEFCVCLECVYILFYEYVTSMGVSLC